MNDDTQHAERCLVVNARNPNDALEASPINLNALLLAGKYQMETRAMKFSSTARLDLVRYRRLFVITLLSSVNALA